MVNTRKQNIHCSELEQERESFSRVDNSMINSVRSLKESLIKNPEIKTSKTDRNQPRPRRPQAAREL